MVTLLLQSRHARVLFFGVELSGLGLFNFAGCAACGPHFECYLSTFGLGNDNYIFIIIIAGYIVASISNIPIFFIQSTLVWAPMFYLGHILKNINLEINKATFVLLLVYLIHVPIFRVLNPFTDYASQTNPQIWGIFSVIGILLGFSFLPLLENVNVRGLSFIGQNTLVVYLVHAPTASVIRIILFKLGIYNILINIIVGFGLSLFISSSIFKSSATMITNS